MRRIGSITTTRALHALAHPATFAALFLLGCGGSGLLPQNAATFREFPIPVQSNVQGAAIPGAWPDDIDVDSSGNAWFAMEHANEIGRMAPDGTYTGFPVHTAGSGMDSVVVDNARRTVWVSEVTAGNIARLNMDTGTVVEIPVPTPNAQPGDLALAPDGTVWFTEGYDSLGPVMAIGKADPATNKVTEIPLPGPRGELDGITVDPIGAVWFVELIDNRVARYANGVFTEFDLPHPGVVPTNIAIDSAGHVWVTEQSGNALAVLDPVTRAWTEHPIPTPGAEPVGLAFDSRGNAWFTEFAANKIGVLLAGSTTYGEFVVPTSGSAPEDVRVAAGRICFTEQYANKIGQISVSGLTP